MTDDADPGLDRVRAGILGAPKAAHLQVVEGGKGGEKNAVQPAPGKGTRGGGKGRGAAADDPTPENTSPLVPLGHRDGLFHFLDVKGQERRLSARAMGSRPELAGLFVGDTSWLFRWFPRKKTVTTQAPDGTEVEKETIIGFQIGPAGECLMAMCGAAGLYGDHVVLRGPGVWKGESGEPVVHTGDLVLLDGKWRPSGFRSGNQVWTSASAAPRPGADNRDGSAKLPGQAGFAAPASVAIELQTRIHELWKFRHSGAEIVAIGLMAIGYYGAAARWRSNGYFIGGTGSGKSLLLDLMRACVPPHAYSTDTTKSGIENAINGRPTGVFIDEAGDRVDQRGAQILLDMVLSASGNDGTRGHRGTADGRGRTFQVLCNVIMATVNPPDMGQAHRDRFTVVDLVKPGAGEDNRAAMEAAIAWAKTQGSALWGRALEGWSRWQLARDAYRTALSEAKCLAREMDQVGAILASWWVLVNDGVPSAAVARDGVGAVAEFIRGADQTEREDGPRRMLQHLQSRAVQMDRSTDREIVGRLVELAFGSDAMGAPGAIEPAAARKWLARIGIRVIRDNDDVDHRGRPTPRGAMGDGMWFGRNHQEFRQQFTDTVWAGDRWTFEMLRHESAREWRRKNVNIGGASGPAIWLSRADWDPPDD